MSKSNATDEEEFDWVQFKKDYAVTRVETQKEKFVRKFKENPMVPIGKVYTGKKITKFSVLRLSHRIFLCIGCAATTVALGLGLWNFRKGNSRMSQKMMRARIGAQGFTVMALLVGVLMTMSKPSS